VLGDNIFHGQGLTGSCSAPMRARTAPPSSATGCATRNATAWRIRRRRQRDRPGRETAEPKSNYAVTGLYFYDWPAPDFAAAEALAARRTGDHRPQPLLPGRRSLHLEKLGRGYAWLDTGTHESLLQASNFIETIETARACVCVARGDRLLQRLDRAEQYARLARRWRRTATAVPV
jgi:glucose-1-phosphate thymidylyltransferase